MDNLSNTCTRVARGELLKQKFSKTYQLGRVADGGGRAADGVEVGRECSVRQRLGRVNTDNSKSVRTCNGRKTRNSSPFRTQWSGRKTVRRAKEGTAIAMVHSGIPTEWWWWCAMECCCYLRKLYDKMAEQKYSKNVPTWDCFYVPQTSQLFLTVKMHATSTTRLQRKATWGFWNSVRK